MSQNKGKVWHVELRRREHNVSYYFTSEREEHAPPWDFGTGVVGHWIVRNCAGNQIPGLVLAYEMGHYVGGNVVKVRKP